jgi:glucose-1-phosphate cytidylyltransferase
MIEIGGQPILWHIMKLYAYYGATDFIICLGYKGYLIKEYFANYVLHRGDVTIDLAKNQIDFHQHQAEPWRVTLVETGDATQTGGRVRRVAKYLNADRFCLTYGDGLADIDLGALLRFHDATGARATVTAVQPPGRFGALTAEGDYVTAFIEKPVSGFINGGFFILSRSVLDLIEGDRTVWEEEPLTRLAEAGQLAAYRHQGFWQPMDTLREKMLLERLWETGQAPWHVWRQA